MQFNDKMHINNFSIRADAAASNDGPSASTSAPASSSLSAGFVLSRDGTKKLFYNEIIPLLKRSGRLQPYFLRDQQLWVFQAWITPADFDSLHSGRGKILGEAAAHGGLLRLHAVEGGGGLVQPHDLIDGITGKV